MSIYLTPTADLLAMVNAAGDVVFDATDLRYGRPHATTADEKAQHNRNTRIAVAVAQASTKGTGHRDVFYDRLDVAALAKADFTFLTITTSTTLTQMIGLLRKFTGAVFTTDDLVDHAPTQDVSTGNVSFLVEAKPTSLGWIGSFTLTVAGIVDISTAFLNDRLDGFK